MVGAWISSGPNGEEVENYIEIIRPFYVIKRIIYTEKLVGHTVVPDAQRVLELWGKL